jgi:hypothetical protein
MNFRPISRAEDGQQPKKSKLVRRLEVIEALRLPATVPNGWCWK